MYQTLLCLYAFILQGILYIMWWDFHKSNSTGWVILMKIFCLESTWEIGYELWYTSNIHKIFIKYIGVDTKQHNIKL